MGVGLSLGGGGVSPPVTAGHVTPQHFDLDVVLRSGPQQPLQFAAVRIRCEGDKVDVSARGFRELKHSFAVLEVANQFNVMRLES